MIATAAGRYLIEPFRANDWVELHQAVSGDPDVEGTLLGKGQADPRMVGKGYVQFGRAYTARLDGRVVACAGILRRWEGLGMAWFTLTPLGGVQAGLDVFWAVRGRFRALVDEMRLRRVEADVRAGWEKGERFVRLLGFRRECEMPHYLPDGGTAARWVLFPVILPSMVGVSRGTA